MSIEIVNTIVKKFKNSNFFLISEFGKDPEIIAAGIKKYEPLDSSLRQVTVFEKNGKISEVGFLTPPIKGLVSYFISEFNEPKVFYNFRDEFTRLEFYPNIDWIDRISCDVDGQWEKNNTGIKNLESGESIDNILLNGFFIQLK
jgi:hypothetical protein